MVPLSTSSLALIMELHPRARITVPAFFASSAAAALPSFTTSIRKGVPSPGFMDQSSPPWQACTGEPNLLDRITVPSSFSSTRKISITNQFRVLSFSAAIRPGASSPSGVPGFWYSLVFIYFPVRIQRKVWLPSPQSS